MTRLLRMLAAIVLLLLLAVAYVFYVLQGPTPLPLPERGAILADVTVIDPGVGRRAGHDVIVRGARITSVRPSESGGGGSAQGSFQGHYVLPGLADAHVHFPPASIPGQTELFAFLFLLHGVTIVRDAGDIDGSGTAPARDGVRAGLFPGPRVIACGPFVDGPKQTWGNTIVVRDADQARAAAREIEAAGFDCVKAYNDLGQEALDALREEAAALGLPVIGHVPWRLDYEAARLDDVQHLTAVQAPLADRTLRYPAVMAAWLTTDEARLRRIASFSREHEIANTPTLVVNERRAAALDYDAIRREPDSRLLPRFYRDVIWSPTEGTLRGVTKEDFRNFREAQPMQRRAVALLHEAGATLRTGSDVLNPFVVPGASLHRELALFVEAGLSPETALALSRDTANALGGGRQGYLEAGAPADLLVFRRDPTRDIEALSTLVAVVADGRLYTRDALDAQLRAYREAFSSAVYDAATVPLVRRALAANLRD